ncbi:MAG: hypothetical protein QOD86_94 [Miltoncostaeaceae bacterium]|jgi:uncharacterized protein (TIGR00730 family)|nr:hypothetical protein [Miltoncostaeaceae bacterium]
MGGTLSAAGKPPAGERVATVFGSARVRPGEPEYEEARLLGRLLAQAGWAVCTGGYDGAMAAVSRGAGEAGGRVIGVTVAAWKARIAPNAWVSEERAAEDLLARVGILLEGDAWLAVAGGVGTLSEVALAWNLLQTRDVSPRPLILVGPRWRRLLPELRKELVIGDHDLELVTLAEDAEEAVRLLG